MTVFIRALHSPVDQKPDALLAAVRSVCAPTTTDADDRTVFDQDPAAFARVPGSPFAYWVSDAVRRLFTTFPRFDAGDRLACRTNSVDNDFRYVRSWWETRLTTGGAWHAWAKGGSFSPWHYDIDTVIVWDTTRSTYTGFLGTENRPLERPASSQHFFRAALTWPRRTNGLSFRALPRESIFGDKGPAAFVDDDSPEKLLALCAVLNSASFGYLISVQLARTELAQSYEVGLVQQSPIPDLTEDSRTQLARLARRAWSLKRSLDTSRELSHAFQMPPGLNEKVTGIDGAAVERELADIQAQIDALAFSLYGISAEDRATIEAPTKPATSDSGDAEAEATDDADDGDDETAVGGGTDALGSWLVGVAFGRFDPRLATGERVIPPEPEPFDPLPSRSPGMYPEGEEPADRPNILVDDEGHADDLATRAIAVAERVKVDAPENLRAWLAKEFFPLHIKLYSKSRRKAPIYWQLATPSASYSVWLYIHAFANDTLFRVQNDYVAPKLAHEERRLESLKSELRDGATAAQRKALAAQEAVVDELRAFLDEVKRVAPLWNPNLDDGVIINFAPLWRLVPQNKSWQKELKSTWDALCDGKYDWAHLAMHLWPERVVPKCAKDRSLAIAHGLEDVFWIEGESGKWTARNTPTKSVNELVQERTSPAVKSALKSLIEAPVASGKSTVRKTRGRREDAAAAVLPDLATVAADAWARPRTHERGEIQAAILAVLKANGTPMDRRQARIASLFCLEPHLLASMLDKTEKTQWTRAIGSDAKKAASASIDATAREWGAALAGLRGRGRLLENLQQNTWTLGADVGVINTRGWPEGRAGFVVNVLRRLQTSAPVDALILRLPTSAQQWVANAA